ncbi:hypothetical protein [Streptomyces sp. GS7]|uniref:hypothetical protein n=1 Tax=Streptomyces sp. GS7 TaxID=2692234 RepID=UPI0013178315|nr:hypothetical protein [Streptomyces sp. GS7]QHC22712.1 hypothetical protein GR130_16005 [Streptomyces sp. GS7]
MSEPMGTGETLPQEEPKAAGAGRTRTAAGRAGRWVRGRSARWVAAGAAVLVIGGGAAAAVAHHHGGEEGHGHDRRTAAGDRGWHDGRGGRGGREDRQESGRADHAAPAPLPSTNAADAVAKASSAVPGGKVESLSPVAEQGGGRAWRVVVLGADGVRHAVTIDGAGDTITGNTVLGG